MNTQEINRERISAFADGEIADQQLDVVLASLRHQQGRDAWEVYHQVGDVLRSEEMAVPLSAGFAERMAARLAAEPVIMLPAASALKGDSCVSSFPVKPEARELDRQRGKHPAKKWWALPGMAAAAAMAAITFMATPQLIGVLKGESAVGMPVAANALMPHEKNTSTIAGEGVGQI